MSIRSLIERLRVFFGFADRLPTRELSPPPPDPVSPPLPGGMELNFEDRLPKSAVQRVQKIRALLVELEQQAESHHLPGPTLEIQRLKTSHLPKLLQSYIDIPAQHRAEVFRETGHSASYLLCERLDKIYKRLQEMSRQVARGNLNAFATNIRFVDTQYGTSVFD